MPTSRKRRHGSGKKPPSERPYVSSLELGQALRERLSPKELDTLEKQIARAIEKACADAVVEAVNSCYVRHWGITMRVLRDRFGWGTVRLRRLWDHCMSYQSDIDDGVLTTEEVLASLKEEDNITIKWDYTFKEKGEKSGV